MARAFFSGVSQITLSTPGVFLPWFSVTRRTARALPLNEWVKRRCNACTLPHLFSFRRLNNTCLKPTHVVADGRPINVVPVSHSVEGRTSSVLFCCHLTFLL